MSLLVMTQFTYLTLTENPSSANPHAIISSRLNSYLKRSFTQSSPCLLAKELVTSHPRRIYFYLTACSSQPISEVEDFVTPPQRSVISPISDDEEMRKRIQLSPSPEVDLSSPEFDDENDPPIPIHSTYNSCAGIFPRDKTISPIDRKGGLSSTPMEGDEQEFTQSAIQLKQRAASNELEEHRRLKRAREQEEKEERYEEGKESDDAASLLGYAEASIVSSAMIRDAGAQIGYQAPTNKDPNGLDNASDETGSKEGHIFLTSDANTHTVDVAHFRSWAGELQSPESIELDELDDLLGTIFE